MHLAILLVAAVAASNQYGPGYGGQPSQPSQPSQYPPSYPYPQPAPLPYPLPYGDKGQGVPRCRNCRRVRAFKDDAKLAYGTVLIKEKRSLGRCTVSIVTCKGEEGQTFTLIDEKKRTLARGSHIRHKIICMGGKRWKTKNADDEKVVFTKLACVVNPVATTVGPSTTVELATTKEPTTTNEQPTTTTAEPSTTSPLSSDCAPGWSGIGYRCYMTVAERLLWDEADQKCETHFPGAKLAVVQSKEEHDFILALLPAPSTMWIGLRRVGSIWTFSNGEVATYCAWGTNQPDYDGDCVYMYTDGKYNDWNCTSFAKPPNYACSYNV